MNDHIVKRYDVRLKPGQCVVLREKRDAWVEHGKPIDITKRSGSGMVVDGYVIGAGVLSENVAVLYRDHAQITVVYVTEQNKNRFYESCMKKGGSA